MLEPMSVSRDHGWFPVLVDAPTGLGRLLELWLDTPLGLGGLLGPSEVPPTDPTGDENCSNLRLVVRKLVLMRKKTGDYVLKKKKNQTKHYKSMKHRVQQEASSV